MTFLFDIGNVLLNLHFDRFHNAVLPVGEEELPPGMAPLKDPLETGSISNDEFVSRSLDILKTNLSPQEFIRAWQDVFSINNPMVRVVDQLKADNHRLILFSNTNGLHAERFLAEYRVFDHFDHHHFSHDVGAIKPHPDFYQVAIDEYDLTPSETIYLDDLPENIATGRDFGFQSFQYDINDHQPCLDWLRERVKI
ncbi:MAG: HAD-IA family hydrolase [Verrucomicrobiaceae bacterium]